MADVGKALVSDVVVDLYAGPGGWDVAARELGLHPIGYEVDDAACATRAAAGHLTIQQDVSTAWVPPHDGLIAAPPCQAFSMAGNRGGHEDLPRIYDWIAACWDGWVDDPTTGEWNDSRSKHIMQPLRWAWYGQPDWIACEQVAPCLPVWDAVLQVLGLWGYDGWCAVLNAADYGVPQTRKRAILVASRTGSPPHPEVTHVDPRKGRSLLHEPWVSMAEALGWGMDDRPGFTICGGNEGGPDLAGGSGARKALKAAMRRDSGPGAAREPRSMDQPSYTIRAAASGAAPGGVTWELDRRTNSKDGRGGMEPTAPVGVERPAPAVTGKAAGQWLLRNNTNENACESMDEPAGTIFTGHRSNGIHWVRERPATSVCGDRRISPPGYRGAPDDYAGDGTYIGDRSMDEAIKVELWELAVLQSFPADYPFQGTKTKQAEQIGNAVPPGLARAVLTTVTPGGNLT